MTTKLPTSVRSAAPDNTKTRKDRRSARIALQEATPGLTGLLSAQSAQQVHTHVLLCNSEEITNSYTPMYGILCNSEEITNTIIPSIYRPCNNCHDQIVTYFQDISNMHLKGGAVSPATRVNTQM